MRVTEENLQGNVNIPKTRYRRRIRTILFLEKRGRSIKETRRILKISFTIIATNLLIEGLII